MTDALSASKSAWERALGGMRTSHPTYKPALLLTILERIEADAAAGRAFDGAFAAQPEVRVLLCEPASGRLEVRRT